MTPIRVQRKRTKGFKLPPNTVSVTRPGKWGNPFKPGQSEWHPINGGYVKIKDVAHALELYRMYMESGLASKLPTWMKESIHELKGKNLACFCAEGSPCHADILLELANKEV